MDVNALITIATGVAGVAGGAWGGAHFKRGEQSQIAADTVEILQVSVEELRTQNAEKTSKIDELISRVNVLESLVTQRAEVEAVHVEVTEVKGIVNRIAVKVGA